MSRIWDLGLQVSLKVEVLVFRLRVWGLGIGILVCKPMSPYSWHCLHPEPKALDFKPFFCYWAEGLASLQAPIVLTEAIMRKPEAA